MRRFPAIIGAALAAALAVSPALAADETALIDNFDDWSAFAEVEAGNKVCYAGGFPKKAEGKYKTRGDTFTMVTHRPAEKTLYVVSIRAGYVHKKDSEVTVTIGERTFRLFTEEGFAWASDAKMDRALTAAMKAGSAMVVKGISGRGTETTDTYSLKGFTAAINAVNKACGVAN